MTEYAELVTTYKKFRKITRKLHSILIERVSKKTMQECGRKLGIMKGDTFVFRDMDETAVLMDYCIYDYCEDGSNAVSRYIAEYPPVPDSDEYVVLKAMSESFYALVQVQDVLPGVGVRVNNLMGNKQFLLIDMGFSETAVEGVVLATRILPFEDFIMTSGAALPVDVETFSEILDSLFQQFDSEDGQYINIDLQQKADLTATIIRLCLKKEMAAQIAYEDVEMGPVSPPMRSEPHIGRNEPCPCGSGKKYKRCCGR